MHIDRGVSVSPNVCVSPKFHKLQAHQSDRIKQSINRFNRSIFLHIVKIEWEIEASAKPTRVQVTVSVCSAQSGNNRQGKYKSSLTILSTLKWSRKKVRRLKLLPKTRLFPSEQEYLNGSSTTNEKWLSLANFAILFGAENFWLSAMRISFGHLLLALLSVMATAIYASPANNRTTHTGKVLLFPRPLFIFQIIMPPMKDCLDGYMRDPMNKCRKMIP